MARKREHGVDLPEHVHKVHAKGKDYYFYQPHRGTPRQGLRTPLPRDPASVEFWDELRKLAGAVPGYSGTVAAMIDAYLASPEFGGYIDADGKVTVAGLAEGTKRNYRIYLGRARLAIGKHPPDAIRPKHIFALRDQYAETPIAANTIIRALSAVYIWGRPRDYAMTNPCAGIPKNKAGEYQPWPDDLIKLVLDKARWEVRRYVLLTLYTGQRESDVLRMSLRDIDGDEILVTQKKTGKVLSIALDKRLASVVDDCRAAGTIYLITRTNGEPFTPDQFRAMWGREMAKEVFKPIRDAGLVPHGLCKNAHNSLFEAGNTAKEVQAVTGRSPTMVQHYSKGYDQRARGRRAVRRREEAEAVLQTPEIHKQKQARSSKEL